MRPLLGLLLLAAAAVLALMRLASDRPGENVMQLQRVEGASDASEHADLTAPEQSAAAATRSEAEFDAAAPASVHAATEIDWPKGFARIDFLVRDGAAPVEGASLILSEEVSPTFVGDLDESSAARTDERGRAALYVRPTRTVEVRAAARGSMWATTQHFTSPFEDRTRKITVELNVWPEDAAFEVLARSLPSLAPLEGAVVLVAPPVGVEIISTGPYTTGPYTTGPDGRVAVPWREGLRYGVTAAGHATGVIDRPSGRGGPPVLVDLKKNARLSGSIAFPQGEPPALATVRLLGQQILSNPEKRALMEELRRRMPAIQKLETAEVRADGSWSIEGISFGAGVDEIEGLRVDAIAGRVDGDKGTKRTRGRVTVGMRGVGEESWERQVKGGRDGSFQFDFVPVGRQVEVAALLCTADDDLVLGAGMEFDEINLDVIPAIPEALMSVRAIAGELDVVLALNGK